MSYLPGFSPHTCNMNKIHVPVKVLLPPNFPPPKWQREMSQDSDCQSLAEEGQRILEREDLSPSGLECDSLEEDSLDEEQGGAECDSSGAQRKAGSGRKQQSVDKYSSLRYNPNWKNMKVARFYEAEKASQIAGGCSVDSSSDSFYLHSVVSSEEKEAKTQVPFSEFGSESLRFHEPDVMGSNEPVGLQTKKKESAGGCHSKGSAFPLQMQQDRPQRPKRDFVKKNKRTLGLPSEKINSYLELHDKKQEMLQEQVADPKTVDEEPLQGVSPSQSGKMKPEDKWCLKGQQLKDQHNKFSQRSKTNLNWHHKGRGFPRNDSQQPPGKPAEPKSWHHSQQQISGFQAAPSAVERDNSSALQEWLCSASGGGPDVAEKSNTYLNNLPNSKHFFNQALTRSTYPLHPIFHHFNPAKAPTPANTGKCQQGSPNGIPCAQQVPVQLLAGADSANGQAHPSQRNLSAAFNASFQEPVKNQVSFQDCKKSNHKHKSSPTAPCDTCQFAQLVEQHHQGIPDLAGAQFADRWLLSLLTPAAPQLQSGSEWDPERREGNPLGIICSNPEGCLLHMEKQKQPKVSKKSWSTKVCINANVTLGGLGPDYEAIKETKQKLKLQREYSRQIKDYNMKNITVQRLPTKPQLTTSVVRQKALEYAKTIPRPKIFMTRQSDREVKEERVLSLTSDGICLSEISPLETLRRRHEKEKEVVAAFKALHIF